MVQNEIPKMYAFSNLLSLLDGNFLATGSEDGYLMAWDVNSRNLVYRSRTHSHWVWDLAWLPDNVSYLFFLVLSILINRRTISLPPQSLRVRRISLLPYRVWLQVQRTIGRMCGGL